MAKQQKKQQVVKNQQGQGQGLLIEEVLDDNLLPDAQEELSYPLCLLF